MVENYVYKKVDSVVFGMMSPELVKKMACAKVVTPELYDKEGYPVDGGLMDIRLGVIDPGLRCKTCGGNLRDCMGHFGYLELARPIIHLKYADVILNFLRCSCRECGKLLTDKKVKIAVEEDEGAEHHAEEEAGEDEVSTKKQVKSITSSLRNVKKCPHCGAKQFQVKLERPTTFLEDDKRLNPIDIRTRLERISDSDIAFLGLDPSFARPEWMVLIILPVPPVTIRPSITLETGERSEDDLTHKLGDIVRINQRLFENINAGAPEIIIEDLWDLLQYHITTYFDNEVSQVPPARHRSGQALRTLTERIKSKEGRFRHNLAGKRVNYAARTVISPDSKMELNEVGVPIEVAMELTVPERVVEWNLKRLKKFVENGPKKYVGSNYVVRPDGKKKKITDETQEQLLEELQPGYIVERHLMDGDIVIFNRQPTLHRMSIMAHRVRVLPGKSFRLNPAICNPYNADFDGDEMNLHVPQTEEARAEAEILMEVQTQIITPKSGLNVIGCSDDAITGNYLLTKNIKMSKEDAVQMLHSVGVLNIERFDKFKKTVDGKEIFSAILPDGFDFSGYSKSKEPIVIKNGYLIEGVIDKSTIGQDKGDLIRALYAKYGSSVGLDLLGKIFRLGIAVLLKHGFTTSIADTDLPQEVSDKCKETIYNSERRVAQLIEQYSSGELEALPGLTLEATLEAKIMEVLNRCRQRVGEIIAESNLEENSTLVMALSGAKGSYLNLSMIAACVGQQALRGKRIELGYRGRTLSIFTKGELSPRAKGFIKRGYKEGLTPEEYFMHAMTGRDSLMDTALRTPKSGYLYRRLASALQDIRVEYDNTVRDANQNIVQFIYGEDGLDVSKTEGGKINVARIIREVLGE
ncbi:DNA-directed RNA polymerase subunit A' [Candidatus Woesearchaeota archaeon]|nr:DNA-directed RNA polymerase subunit A' [Candidatus Woesearchaeota archaeon]